MCLDDRGCHRGGTASMEVQYGGQCGWSSAAELKEGGHVREVEKTGHTSNYTKIEACVNALLITDVKQLKRKKMDILFTKLDTKTKFQFSCSDSDLFALSILSGHTGIPVYSLHLKLLAVADMILQMIRRHRPTPCSITKINATGVRNS